MSKVNWSTERDRRYWPATMKNLFDPTVVDDVKQRILSLHPKSDRLWGNLPVTLALTHCTAGFHMAAGTLRPKRAPFPAYVLGRLIKPLVFGDDKPIRRNSPSSPELFLADPAQSDFEGERTRLLHAIDRFVTTARAAAPPTHTPSSARSNRNSGRFSCTNTWTITCVSSASNAMPGRTPPSRTSG